MNPSPLISRFLSAVLVFFTALFVGISGNDERLPLDDHEVLVARTSEEMLARGSWLVPYMNDVPRTAKPPLAYWATMLTDVLGDRDGIISEREARVPVVIGGVLWALATLALGSILCGRRIGFIAALLLVGSTGFLYYSHSARPELLYAMLCTAGLACFAKQWRIVGEHDRSPFTWTSVGWAMMGLAVLTKGPQLPIVMLAAWAIGMAAMGERRRILKTLRPFSGVLIMTAVSLWWFLLMWQGVEGAGDRMERETIGRLLQVEGKPLSRIIDPYYFYRVIVLLLPWALFYVAALASPWIKEIHHNRSSRLLWWISIITLAALHLTFNRRWYYQLPTLSVLCVLMAWVSMAVGSALIERGRTFIWKLVLATHVLAFFAALLWMWSSKPEFLKPPALAVIGLGVMCFVALALMFRPSQNHERATKQLILTALCSIALMVLVGLRVSPWKIERFHRRDFILEVGRTIPTDASLIGWHNDWQQEQYYLHRPIPSFERRNDLIGAIRAALPDAPLWLLSNSRKPLDLPPAISLRSVHEVTVDVNEVVTLWRVESR